MMHLNTGEENEKRWGLHRIGPNNGNLLLSIMCRCLSTTLFLVVGGLRRFSESGCFVT